MSDPVQVTSYKDVGVQTSPYLQSMELRVEGGPLTPTHPPLQDFQSDQFHSRSLSLPESFNFDAKNAARLTVESQKEADVHASIATSTTPRQRHTRSKPSLSDLRLPSIPSADMSPVLRNASTPTYNFIGDSQITPTTQDPAILFAKPSSSFSRRIASDPQPRDRTSSEDSSNYASSSLYPSTSVTTDDLQFVRDLANSLDSPRAERTRTPSSEFISESETPESVIFINNIETSGIPSFLHAISNSGSVNRQPEPTIEVITTPTPVKIVSTDTVPPIIRHSSEPDWITWANSPPRPIPALHGPPSLPYARCPSGAEGVVFSDPDAPRQTVWGIGDRAYQTSDDEPQPDYLDSFSASPQKVSRHPAPQKHDASSTQQPKPFSRNQSRAIKHATHTIVKAAKEYDPNREMPSWPIAQQNSKPDMPQYPELLQSPIALNLYKGARNGLDYANPVEEEELEWAYMEEQLRPLYLAEQQRQIWLEEEQRRLYIEAETRRLQEEDKQRRLYLEELIRRDDIIRSIRALTMPVQDQRIPNSFMLSKSHHGNNPPTLNDPAEHPGTHARALQNLISTVQQMKKSKETNSTSRLRSRTSTEESTNSSNSEPHGSTSRNFHNQIQPRGPPTELTTAGLQGPIAGRRYTVSAVPPSIDNFSSSSQPRHRYTRSLEDVEKYSNNLANPRSIPLARLAGKVARPTLLDEIPEESESPGDTRSNAPNTTSSASSSFQQPNDLHSIHNAKHRHPVVESKLNYAPAISSPSTSIRREPTDRDRDTLWVDATPSTGNLPATASPKPEAPAVPSPSASASNPSAVKKSNTRQPRKGGRKSARNASTPAGPSGRRDEGTTNRNPRGNKK